MERKSPGQSRFPNRILCGLDLDGHSNNAATAAVWLSERLGVALEFVHAFPTRPILWGKEAQMPEWTAGTDVVGRALRKSLHTLLSDAPGELALATDPEVPPIEVTSGPPVQVLLERARATGADLIVLGAHKKHAGLDFGNTVRGVLAHAPRGVWVQPDRPRPLRRILAPIDLSPDSLAALATARDLAQVFGAKLTALFAFESPGLGASFTAGGPVEPSYAVSHLLRSERAEFDAAMAGFEWRGVAHDTRFEEGSPAQVVLGHQGEYDLVVMGTHGRTGLSAALVGSVAHGVLRASRIPVLALRYPRRTYVF
jgi:nucleotide-binding universal stress UspA family protein